MKRPISDEQAMVMLARVYEVHTGYPQGDPIPISITLTDEQWNAIAAACQITLITHSLSTQGPLPDWLLNQIIESGHVIGTTVGDVVKHMEQNRED